MHDPLAPADLRSEGVEVEPGYISTILITPKQEMMQDKGKLEINIFKNYNLHFMIFNTNILL